jgi:hypothetical protein
MGTKGSAEQVASDMRPPNYRGAVQKLRGIKAKKDRIAGLNGEISGIFDSVEGFKCNKKGARIFMMLDSLEKVERDDILRTVNGCAEAAEWDKEIEDLADMAAGTVVSGRFGGGAAPADGDREMDELEAVVEQPDEGHAESPTMSRAQGALARARQHLSGGAAPEEPRPDPDAGDHTDLVQDTDLADGAGPGGKPAKRKKGTTH